MQFPFPVTLATLATVAACVPGGPIYFGPPISTLQGHVYSAESASPIDKAEVCVFGVDTTCARATTEGAYRIQVPEQVVAIRFRGSGFSAAMVDSVRLVNDSVVTVNCALTNRVMLSDKPLACFPVPGR